MILAIKNALSTIAPKLTYDVLIENQEDGTVKATLLSLPECQGLGATKEEALNNLIQLFQARKPEIVTLEIEAPKIEHPLIKFAEMHKDNPLFTEALEYIEDEGNAWDVLEALTGTIEAQSDWSSQHDHYLYGNPKHDNEIRE
ncbi:type II toxin-antitoxin system HicB family antitoxin [Anabaena sp. WFMT]|uniref:type II toxin-antitoxin system HicB family antitoxin n=1 Tax=Anabaena sp. WFMT TaxID=3449730 RepID=UPI003F287618